LQRYIIALIKQSYYEPAGVQCHKTGRKTGSLDIRLVWVNNAALLSLNIISAAPNKEAECSCCAIAVQ